MVVVVVVVVITPCTAKAIAEFRGPTMSLRGDSPLTVITYDHTM